MSPYEAASLRVGGNLAKAVDKLAEVVDRIPAPQPSTSPKPNRAEVPIHDNIKVTIHLPREMVLLLKRDAADKSIARRRNVTMSAVVRGMLEAQLGSKVTW